MLLHFPVRYCFYPLLLGLQSCAEASVPRRLHRHYRLHAPVEKKESYKNRRNRTVKHGYLQCDEPQNQKNGRWLLKRSRKCQSKPLVKNIPSEPLHAVYYSSAQMRRLTRRYYILEGLQGLHQKLIEMAHLFRSFP